MGISIWQLLIILVIVVLLFGTKKLRNMGGDLGGAIRSFRSSMRDGEAEAQTGKPDDAADDSRVIEGETTESSSESQAETQNKDRNSSS